jgi:hypothetical protein
VVISTSSGSLSFGHDAEEVLEGDMVMVMALFDRSSIDEAHDATCGGEGSAGPFI